MFSIIFRWIVQVNKLKCPHASYVSNAVEHLISLMWLAQVDMSWPSYVSCVQYTRCESFNSSNFTILVCLIWSTKPKWVIQISILLMLSCLSYIQHSLCMLFKSTRSDPKSITCMWHPLWQWLKITYPNAIMCFMYMTFLCGRFKSACSNAQCLMRLVSPM